MLEKFLLIFLLPFLFTQKKFTIKTFDDKDPIIYDNDFENINLPAIYSDDDIEFQSLLNIGNFTIKVI